MDNRIEENEDTIPAPMFSETDTWDDIAETEREPNLSPQPRNNHRCLGCDDCNSLPVTVR